MRRRCLDGAGARRRRARAAARRRLADRRRRRLAGERPGLEQGTRPDRDSCRRSGRRARPVRGRPERAAGDGGGRRRRGRARPARGGRRRRARSARLELLPRPGRVHAVADAGVGELRPARRACLPAAAPTRATGRDLLRARLRLRRPDGRLGVAQLLPAHLAGVHGALPARDLVRRRARGRQLRARPRRRARATTAAGALRETAEGRGRVDLRVVGLALAVAATPVGFLQSQQAPSGAFAEAGGSQGPLLTAWAALGLRASGADTGKALDYLQVHEDALPGTIDAELVALAESALGGHPAKLLARIRSARHPSGRIGPNVNSTIWGILALRQARRAAPPAAVRFVLRQQARSGGWAWYLHGQPDSNDTAAAIEALRSAGVTGAPIRRGLAYLVRLRNRDGGFELTPGRGSDAQSTAWAVQAFVAAGRPLSEGALAYLRRLRRPDGRFRYSHRYATKPVWVTTQVLPALHRRAFPLRSQ